MTVIDWLLDADPAIRWQVLRDLLDAPADVVAAGRARVAHGHEETPEDVRGLQMRKVRSVARPAGFEPTTPSSASWCSIH